MRSARPSIRLARLRVPLNADNVSCLHLAWGDYDADGDPDLAVLGEGLANAITVYRNTASTLTSVFHDESASATVLAWGKCAIAAGDCFSLAPTL